MARNDILSQLVVLSENIYKHLCGFVDCKRHIRSVNSLMPYVKMAATKGNMFLKISCMKCDRIFIVHHLCVAFILVSHLTYFQLNVSRNDPVQLFKHGPNTVIISGRRVF